MFRCALRIFTNKSTRLRQQKSAKQIWRVTPSVCELEDRLVPSNYLVTTTADIYVPPAPTTPPAPVSLRYALEQIHQDNSGPVMNVLLPAGTYNIGLPVSGSTDSLGNKVGGAFMIAPPDGVTDVYIYGGYVSGTPRGTGTNALTLDGNAAGTIINAQGFDRVFEIDPETSPSPAPALNVHFVNMTITGGAPASKAAASGGGICFDDPTFAPDQNSLSLSNVVVTGNLSTSSGGGIYTYNASINVANSAVSNNHAQGLGGGIGTSTGNISVANSAVNGNTAAASGGGIYYNGDVSPSGSFALGTLNISGSTVDDNSAHGNGGGIYAQFFSSVSVSNSQVNHNVATNEGGGIYTNGGNTTIDHAQVGFNLGGGTGQGGGICVIANTGGTPTPNELSVVSSDISGNKTTFSGGGIYNQDPTLIITYSATPNPYTGNVNSTINNNVAGYSGGGIYNLYATTFEIYGTAVPGAAAIQGAQISGNDAAKSGGGIYSNVTGSAVVLSLVAMDGNDAGLKGGAASITGSSLLLTGLGGTPSVISNNESADSGGGIYMDATVETVQSTQFLGNQAASGSGGGVYDSGATTTSISGGTLFAGNQAGGSGGGVYTAATSAVLNNITFAPAGAYGGNVSGDNGGGLNFNSGGTLSVASSSFVGNTADEQGGGISAGFNNGEVSFASTASFSNTLVANNSSNTGGGGLMMVGGFFSPGLLNIALSTFAGNLTAGSGGGVNTGVLSNIINSSSFVQNAAAVNGGGIDYNNFTFYFGNGPTANLVLQNSTLAFNRAADEGGGIDLESTSEPTQGGSANIINTTVAGNNAGGSGGGIANTAGDVASLLYDTIAFNQAPVGGGIATTTGGAANTSLGNTIVSQNLNFAYPGVNFVTKAAYPGSQNGNLDPAPPFPLPAVTGPDVSGTLADLTETGLVATMGSNLSAAVAALAAPGVTIGHNVIGTFDGMTGLTSGGPTGNQIGTSNAPILAVQALAPNGGSTLVGPNLPGGLVQYMAPPAPAPAGTSNPLTTPLNNGFADTFVFNVAPGDQRGTPVLNTTTGLSQQYLRPITISFTMPPSNNPTVGAMQVT